MKVTTSKQFEDLCDRETQYRQDDGPYHSYTVGLVTPPDDLILWILPCTVEQWVKYHNDVMHEWGANYTETLGNALTASRLLCYDADRYRLSEVPAGEPEYRSGALTPWFEGIDGPNGIAEWTDVDSVEFTNIWTAIARANGSPSSLDLPDEQQSTPTTPAEWRAQGRSRGRWIAGCFRVDPTAELFVRSVSEAEQYECRRRALRREINGDETYDKINAAEFGRRLCTSMLLSGPGGERLTTADDVNGLQIGAAQTIVNVGLQLSFRPASNSANVRVVHAADQVARACETTRPQDSDVVGGEVPASSA